MQYSATFWQELEQEDSLTTTNIDIEKKHIQQANQEEKSEQKKIAKTILTSVLILLLSAITSISIIIVIGGIRFSPKPPVEDSIIFLYEDNGDGTCTITGFSGKSKQDLIIPKEINGLIVSVIGDKAFKVANYSPFTGNLIIPDSVTIIGEGAFSGCTRLTGNLIIPKSVTTIGSNAFSYCRGFTGSLILSENITIIGNFAFCYCSNLTQVEFLGNAPKNFGRHPFSGCNHSKDFKIIYNSAKSDWSTPEWNGYPCYPRASEMR